MKAFVGPAAALAWLAGTALQLQQSALSARSVYVTLGLLALLLLASAAWLLRGCKRASGGAELWALAALCVALGAAAYAQTGLRAQARVAGWLAPGLQGADLTVEVRVLGLPTPSPSGVVFDAQLLRGWDAQGRALAPLPERLRLAWSLGWPSSTSGGASGSAPTPDVQATQVWRLPVRLKRVHASVNPGGWDFQLTAFERGIGAQGSVRAAGKAQLLSAAAPSLAVLRQALRDRILLQGLPLREAQVLAALAVGDQSAIAPRDWEVFRRTGVAHLMSISGLHVALFAWLGATAAGALWRRSPRLALAWPTPQAARWLGVACALAYALLAGWGVPAQRTVWMLALAAWVAGRGWRWPALHQAAVVAAGVVALDPWALRQPGFWLSFGAVALLMILPRPHVAAMQPDAQGNQVAGWAARAKTAAALALRTQAWAFVLLAPLSAALFHQVSLAGLLANLLAIPWITFVVTPLALLGAVLPALWHVAAALLAPLLDALAWLAAWGGAPLAVAAAPVWALPLALLGVVALVLPLPWGARLLGLPLLLPLLAPPLARPAPGQFEVIALDVGQGTAVLVRTASHSLLYDAGPLDASGEDDAGRRHVLPALAALGERRLDELVASHGDADHTGGAASVLAGVTVGRLRHGLPADHPLLSGQAQGLTHQSPPPAIACEAGQSWHWDGVTFEVLHPTSPLSDKASSNAHSCVLRVQSAGGRSLLLTGDIEADQEAQLLAQPERLRSDVLIAPHHGSNTSSTTGFIAAVAPRVAVVQAGYLSRYGHPHAPVLARYAQAQVPVVSTPACGAWRWASRDAPASDADASDADAAAHCLRLQTQRYWWPEP